MQHANLFKFRQKAVETELDLYRKEDPCAPDADSLSWWRDRRHKYPVLAFLARKYLGAPASSAPCERLFSTAGNVLTAKRSRLDDENAEKIVFVHENVEFAREVMATLTS